MSVGKGHRDYEKSCGFFSQVVTLQVNINDCHIQREWGLFSFLTVGVSVDPSESILDQDHWKITTISCEFILGSLHIVCIKCLFQEAWLVTSIFHSTVLFMLDFTNN